MGRERSGFRRHAAGYGPNFRRNPCMGGRTHCKVQAAKVDRVRQYVAAQSYRKSAPARIARVAAPVTDPRPAKKVRCGSDNAKRSNRMLGRAYIISGE